MSNWRIRVILPLKSLGTEEFPELLHEIVG